jgi:hypothetical protein
VKETTQHGYYMTFGSESANPNHQKTAAYIPPKKVPLCEWPVTINKKHIFLHDKDIDLINCSECLLTLLAIVP